MPISSGGKLYVTKEQKELARQKSALEYALSAGYALTREGNFYRLNEHRSMIFTSDGRWYWNSRGIEGRALEFIMNYEDRSFPEAVTILTGDAPKPSPVHQSSPMCSPPKKPFVLPPRASSYKRLFAYLCFTRRLDYDIVKSLVDAKRIYQSARNNAVFVGFDTDGVARSAFQRGLNSAYPFKQDVAGSDKSFPFCMTGPRATQATVFEASIDAISHASIAKWQNEEVYDRDRIALGGLSPTPLLNYLKSHPDITHITLALDNDDAGKRATIRFQDVLIKEGYTAENGYCIGVEVPDERFGKDWNDYLLYLSDPKRSKTPLPRVRPGDMLYLDGTLCEIESVSESYVSWHHVSCHMLKGTTTARDFIIREEKDLRNLPAAPMPSEEEDGLEE